MVHMPSHTYLELGRYQEAAKSNREAIKSDDWFIGVAHPQGFFHMYTAHNRQFLACAAMMLGRSDEALKAARSGNESLPFDMSRQMPGSDFFFTTPYMVMTAFARWDDVLREPAPPADFLYLDGIWHYARGLAYCGKGDAAHAVVERDSLVALAASLPAGAMEDLNPAAMLLDIARHVLEGHIAEAQGKAGDGIDDLTHAVAIEDSLRYSEPPDWMCPVRPMLGAMLLRAKRAPEAETAYRGDLKRHPANGWSLHGVAASLRAQGKTAEAAKFDAQFRDAWKDADYKLDVASR
jgi:tetratricopeptide (TPR) repeat protein